MNQYPGNLQYPINHYPMPPYPIPQPVPIVLPPGFKKKEGCNCGKR